MCSAYDRDEGNQDGSCREGTQDEEPQFCGGDLAIEREAHQHFLDAEWHQMAANERSFGGDRDGYQAELAKRNQSSREAERLRQRLRDGRVIGYYRRRDERRLDALKRQVRDKESPS